ncbi:MAG TPA: hypothetical protein PKA05_11140, partial [Roseiflexaceae bacterium]|nr:hypothetical protein [Roseiflexaceae bacterium]
LIALIVFGMRFGGKLYPDAMPGDIGFHANRYTEVVYGRPLLLSRNRGVDFPYPSALYLLIAPLATIEPDVRLMLRLSSALLDALSPFLVYTIAAALIGQGGRWPLAAAALYSLSGALTMTSWWNFSTHIFTQFAHLLLLATLVLAWPQLVAGQIRRHTAVAALLFLQSLVYLGHFGFWINMSLLGGFGLLLLAWHARRARQYRGLLATLLLSFTLAELIATGLFYSSYLALFTAQAQIAADGGLSGLAAREPVAATLLWETLWDAGLRMHFGFFPVPLALGGMLIAVLQLRRYRIEQRQVLIGILLAGTMLVAGIFALLPFVTGAALTTRWLMFAAWAVAVGAVASGARIWQAGQAGRVLLLAAAAYALAITAAMWLAALAWRVRPPEPF